jgi:hypothetical protein
MSAQLSSPPPFWLAPPSQLERERVREEIDRQTDGLTKTDRQRERARQKKNLANTAIE